MNTAQTELIIDPRRPAATYWQDLWRYRGLLYFLAWRDLILRYKQTVIGVAWAIFPSLITVLTFTVIFGKFAHLASGATPYPILVMAAILPWNLFANALSQTGGSLVANSHLITKVYFPRLVIPLSGIVVSLVDFALSFLMLLGLMMWYRYPLSWRILMLPCFLMVAVLTAAGAGIWLAALNVRYRDFRYLVPLAIQLGLYISPVGFSSAIVPERWRTLYSLNPMVGVIDGFRWSILGEPRLDGLRLGLSAAIMALLLVSGLLYFRKVESGFADVI